MVVEADGPFQARDVEGSSHSIHPIAEPSAPATVLEIIDKPQLFSRDTTKTLLDAQNHKQRLRTEKSLRSVPGFTVRLLTESVETPALSQSSPLASSRSSSGSGAFSSPLGVPSTQPGASGFSTELISGPHALPLPMTCWHKANGIDCKGKTALNAKSRNLLWYVDLFLP
jgi:hypothetical protein